MRGDVCLKYCVLVERVVKRYESHRDGMTKKGEGKVKDEAFVSNYASRWAMAHF